MQILETKEVKKYYQTPSGNVRALDGVSLSVTEGTFGAIVGSSGSGKTTLLHMLGGLDEPTDGEVWVRGTSLKEMSGEEKTVFRRRNIGFVFQNYNLDTQRPGKYYAAVIAGRDAGRSEIPERNYRKPETDGKTGSHAAYVIRRSAAESGDRTGADHETGGDPGR